MVGLAAFLVNFGRVVGELGLFAYTHDANAKQIELTFMRYAVTNYAFFMLFAAAVLYAYLLGSSFKRLSSDLVFLLASLVCLSASGIKSTVLFAASTALFAYYLSVGRFSISREVLIFTGLSLLTGGMFVFVNVDISGERGELVRFDRDTVLVLIDTISDYVFYNYLNFDLEVRSRTTFEYGAATFFFITKLIDSSVLGYYDLDMFYLVDVDRNMGTFLREYYADFGVAGATVLPFVFGVVGGVAKRRLQRRKRLLPLAILSLIMTASLFAFFGNQFIRLQFFFVAGLAFIADHYARIYSRRMSKDVCPQTSLCAKVETNGFGKIESR